MIRKFAAIVAMTLTGLSALGPSAQGAEFECRDRVLIDYAQALKKMPSNHLPDERLSFAPHDLELKAGKSVLVNGDPVSYTLKLVRALSEDGRHVAKPARLNWTVDMEIDLVNRFGRPLATAQHRRWRVKVLSQPERRLNAWLGPGLYRVSLGIQKLDGSPLSSYRQFIRVLPRRQNLSIGIRGSGIFQPGETITARIENRGTLEAFFPESSGLTLERLDGAEWVEAKNDEPDSAIFPVPEYLAGGRASPCTFSTIPADSEPGEYRLSVVVQPRVRAKPRTIVQRLVVS
jgi:hypothetical protein